MSRAKKKPAIDDQVQENINLDIFKIENKKRHATRRKRKAQEQAEASAKQEETWSFFGLY